MKSRFILLLGAFIAIFSQVALAGKESTFTRNTVLTPEEESFLANNAQDKFDILTNNIESIAKLDDVFWQLANALDSMVNYCQVAQIDCTFVGQKAIKLFDETRPKKPWWWDDYGWWGGLFLRLFDLTEDEQYLTYANICFEKMSESTKAWDHADPETQQQQTPLFENGCFNSALKPLDANNFFEGIQNTVTNVLRLKLSVGLFENSFETFNKDREKNKEQGEKARAYWKAAHQQSQWFLDWFKEGLLNRNRAGDGHSLIEERVSKYNNTNPYIGYYKDRFWAADQGQVITALAMLARNKDMLAKDNPLGLDIDWIDSQTALDLAMDIAVGVSWYMASGIDGVLEPYVIDDPDKFPDGDDDDYIVGPGVFMRNLLYSAQSNDQLKAVFADDDYKDIISANAEYALENNYDGTDLMTFVSIGNDLDLITAALALGVPFDLHHELKPSVVE